MVREIKFEMSMDEIVRHVYMKYKNSVRPALIKAGKDAGEWDEDCIREHFTSHIGDIGFEIKQQIETLCTLNRTMVDTVVQKDAETGELKVQTKNQDAILKNYLHIAKMLNLKPQNTMTFNSRIAYSTATDHVGGNTRKLNTDKQ